MAHEKKRLPGIIKILICMMVAAFAFCGICAACARFILGIRRQTLEEALKWQGEHYDTSWFDTLDKEEYSVNGYENYLLHVMLVRNPEPSDRYVILSHGYTDNRYGNLKYMRDYLRNGYNCITYDLRGHGQNEKTFCTYSIRESRDLVCLIDDTYERYGSEIELGLHGESLGSATTVTALGQRQNVAFAVCDCGFSDILNVLEWGGGEKKMPPWFLKAVSFMAKICYGYSLEEMRPVDSLASNEVPVMFIHGDEDNFILPENSLRMRNTTAGYSEYHLIEGAGHAESVLKDPEQYSRLIDAFLEKVHGGWQR